MFAFGRGMFDAYGAYGNWWIGGIAMLIGVILIGVVIYLLVNNSRHTGSKQSSDALDILKERLAKGEIDEETYEQLLKKISRS